MERLGACRGAARGSDTIPPDTIGGIGGDETGGAAAGFLSLLYWEEKVLKNETPMRIWRVSVTFLMKKVYENLYEADNEGEEEEEAIRVE